jgi:hypothetical protein
LSTKLPLTKQDVEMSDSESEVESDVTDGSSCDSSDEITAAPVTPPQFVQKFIAFALGLRLLLSAIMNTAGKVVVTILLGLAGTSQKAATLDSHVFVLHARLKGLHWLSILCCPAQTK